MKTLCWAYNNSENACNYCSNYYYRPYYCYILLRPLLVYQTFYYVYYLQGTITVTVEGIWEVAQSPRVSIQSQLALPPKFRPFLPDHWPLTLNFNAMPRALEVLRIFEDARYIVQVKNFKELEIGDEELYGIPHDGLPRCHSGREPACKAG